MYGKTEEIEPVRIGFKTDNLTGVYSVVVGTKAEASVIQTEMNPNADP